MFNSFVIHNSQLYKSQTLLPHSQSLILNQKKSPITTILLKWNNEALGTNYIKLRLL